jgi:hypothetical protein
MFAAVVPLHAASEMSLLQVNVAVVFPKLSYW